jgi:toxin YoeB
MKITFSETAWAEYVGWQSEDKKALKKINNLIKDIQRNGLVSGIGQPELLKYVGAYSRRIDEKNRLVYRSGESESDVAVVEIISCKGHYEHF